MGFGGGSMAVELTSGRSGSGHWRMKERMMARSSNEIAGLWVY
jgi:hypothetical protein